MIIEELKKEFADNGIDMKFVEGVPEDRDPRRPVIWLERYPKTQMILGYPETATDFDIAYTAFEGLALARRIDFDHYDAANEALQNAWVLHSMVEKFGAPFRERVVDILKWRISSLARNENSDESLAYALWSRMAAIDAFEMLRPVRQARPRVAELVEEIRKRWHIPSDANDAVAMYQDLPVPVTTEET